MRDLVCGKDLPAEGTPYADESGSQARYFCGPECLTEFTADRSGYLRKHRTMPSIWLAMSGGGFRAALFHYGCLKRLHEVGLLPHVSGVSATSGGAYVAALLGVHSEDLDLYADPPRLGLWRYDWPAFEQALLRLVRHGVLWEVGLLVSAAILYAVGTLAGLWHPQLGAFAAGAGLAAHLSLAVFLYRQGAHRHSYEERLYWKHRGRDIGWTSWKAWRRFFEMLVMPAYLRWNILDLHAFHGLPLASLHSHPRIYLGGYDLNTGMEMVFSKYMIAPLERATANSLWYQSAWPNPKWQGGDIGIALAVAASSALPPYFRPVRVRGPNGLIGVFVDGGLTDNLAMNVPRAFSLYARREDGMSPDPHPANPFRDETKLVLMLDASRGVIPKAKRQWSRLRSLKRLVDVIGTPGVDSAISTLEFLDMAGITSRALGLRVGFMPRGGLADRELDLQIARVRTNLDGFSPIECATLAYCGYLCVEELIAELPSLGISYPLKDLRLKDLSEMLPDGVEDVPADPDALRAHLRYSHRRFLIARWVGRSLGI